MMSRVPNSHGAMGIFGQHEVKKGDETKRRLIECHSGLPNSEALVPTARSRSKQKQKVKPTQQEKKIPSGKLTVCY